MFHLLPRLQAAQEQRDALGAEGADLNKVTSFSAVLAEPLLDDENQAQFYVRQPKTNQPFPPFYIERTLARLERESVRPFDEQTAGLLTAAEQRAMLLLAATESMLEPLHFNNGSFSAPANGLAYGAYPNLKKGQNAPSLTRRATRADLFRTALTHAKPLARLLETNLLDPIRRDALVEDDPFVQTTLYVVAPLFEPLAAALIWPTVTQLMERAGRQHIAQVVALFATGSYATDLTRPVESAASFAALAELEMLTGIRRNSDSGQEIRNMINEVAPALNEVVGQPLFDFIYLLDREKSNQGLAQDSHELAVAAANTLEALSVAGGNLFIQEQLGLGSAFGEPRPYSLIGAACDYVPLGPIFHAVNRQEESRLVREWVLRNTDEDIAALGFPPRPAEGEETPAAAMHRAAVTQAAIRLPGVLTTATPTSIQELEVSPSFTLPQPLALSLRRVPLAKWGDAFQNRVDELAEYIRLAVGPEAMDDALGIGAVSPEQEWFRYDADTRMLPLTVTQMQERLLDDLAASPTGLSRAQTQVQRWLHAIDQARQQLHSLATPNARQLARVQRELALRNWEASYEQAVARTPSRQIIGWGTLIVMGLVVLVAGGYITFSPANWQPIENWMTLAGLVAGVAAIALVIYRLTYARVRKLRRERVALAQEELRILLQESVTDGLVAAYDRLVETLNRWGQILAEAATELSTLSTSPTLPAVPPPGVPQLTLYQPQINQALWNRCLAFLRAQQDAQGQLSEERLDKIWGTPSWRNEMRTILSGVPQAGQTQARTIAQFIRETVRQSVAPASIEQPNPVRSELIRSLAREFSIEHLLWRSEQEEEEITRRLRALEHGLPAPPPRERNELQTNRRYVENAWNRAKPAGNYDVADRLAVYGTVIDFATAAGNAGSDLTRALLEEFNVTLLPTENPFSVTFVRSVHGLSLRDLDAMRRYRDEIDYLSPEERMLVLLASPTDPLYRTNHVQSRHPTRKLGYSATLNGS